jgi:hypothetical protein
MEDGDLQGAVAATILGQNNDGSFNVQHYWITSSGDTIKFNVAHLKPLRDGNSIEIPVDSLPRERVRDTVQ